MSVSKLLTAFVLPFLALADETSEGVHIDTIPGNGLQPCDYVNHGADCE